MNQEGTTAFESDLLEALAAEDVPGALSALGERARGSRGTGARYSDVAGGTPGRANSIYTTSLPSNASLAMTPNPFSPDGDGFEDFCSIRYNLPQTTALIRVTIFDIKGRLIRTLANGELTGPKGELIWDGFDDGRQRARIGPYIVFLEAIDSQGGTIATAKAVAVVATKL